MKIKMTSIMRPCCAFFLTLLLYTSCTTNSNPIKVANTDEFEPIPVNYPDTRKDSTVTDDYHGVVLADPFRWLEDDNVKETVNWVQAQNHATYSYLDKIPFREKIEQRLQSLWNYERYTVPFKEGNAYYFFKNDGLQNQAVLYQQTDLAAKPKVVLDPNFLSLDGTTALGGTSFNKTGTLMAYQVSEGGSDWQTIRVMNIQTGLELEDKIEWVKFSGISWAGDGFYYSRYPEPSGDTKLSGKNELHQVYYHKIGTPQSADQLVFVDEDHPEYGYAASTTADENYLVIQVWKSTSGNALLFKDLRDEDSKFRVIESKFNNDITVVGSLNDQLLVKTNRDAPNQRLILVDTDKPRKAHWKELISESEDVLQDVKIIDNKIVATYIHNASSKIKVFDAEGTFIDALALPGIGTVRSIKGGKEDPIAFYSFESYTRPVTIYQLDMNTLESTVFKAPTIDFDSDKYVTKQVWYPSKDGTKIPMFVTHKKGLNMDGKRPTLLYGYGGFDISILPAFNTSRLSMCPILLENDGIFAVANIRGGGEFGAEWHQSGTLDQKQNVFDDFQAAAEYLISEAFTSSEQLAIYGRSNGGLLVGACMTQRPDLYAVALPAVGVLDMLRYQHFTIGRAWASDYGLSENKKGFAYLSAYSPLHNVKNIAYPATMVTTADHDDRVVPAHSFKFAAELQAKNKGDNPMLIRIATGAGHGAGKSTTQKIEEAADLLSFMFYNFKTGLVEE